MSEIFKIKKSPKVYIQANTNTVTSITYDLITYASIGVFDKLYYFDEEWTLAEEEAMEEWLTYNCTENFIFNKKSSIILAGGRTNPIEVWENRKTNCNKIYMTEYYIKLYKVDIVAFEFTWLTDFISVI